MVEEIDGNEIVKYYIDKYWEICEMNEYDLSREGMNTSTEVDNILYKITEENPERSKVALDSYMRYEFIKKNKYEIDKTKNCLIYANKIRITADLLTNTAITGDLEKNKELVLQDEKSLNAIKAYKEVANTIGNCCPTWNNPASGPGVKNDNIWYKLNKHIIEQSESESPIPLLDRNADGMRLNNRGEASQMFSIFDSKKAWKKLIEDLYLQDYFDYDWNLRCGSRMNIENLDDILEITILIVQRGYRIRTGYKGNVLREKDKAVINQCLKKIGLEHLECIYSKKTTKDSILRR